MTLLLGSKSGYKAVHSNTILSATCSSDQRFKGIYNRLKDKNFYEQSVHECQNVNVQIGKNKVDTAERVFFVSFAKAQAIEFEGMTKRYFIEDF